ncbi:MAG: hypothetical protein ABW171_08010 [Steroidobacter sp.]
MRRPFITFALLATLVTSAHASSWARLAAALPDLGAPPQGTTQWVARSMRMNGLPMTLKVFESRLTPDAVLSHYESLLQTSGAHESRRTTNTPWQVLMLRSKNNFITVHARSVSHGSEGTILVSPTLDPSLLRMRTEFPRPASTRVVSLQEYDDEGAQSEHISLASNRSSFTELHDFSQLLIREGWSVVDTKPTESVQRGYILEVQRQAEHAQLLIVPNAAQPATTAIAITWKK